MNLFNTKIEGLVRAYVKDKKGNIVQDSGIAHNQFLKSGLSTMSGKSSTDYFGFNWRSSDSPFRLGYMTCVVGKSTTANSSTTSRLLDPIEGPSDSSTGYTFANRYSSVIAPQFNVSRLEGACYDDVMVTFPFVEFTGASAVTVGEVGLVDSTSVQNDQILTNSYPPYTRAVLASPVNLAPGQYLVIEYTIRLHYPAIAFSPATATVQINGQAVEADLGFSLSRNKNSLNVVYPTTNPGIFGRVIDDSQTGSKSWAGFASYNSSTGNTSITNWTPNDVAYAPFISTSSGAVYHGLCGVWVGNQTGTLSTSTEATGWVILGNTPLPNGLTNTDQGINLGTSGTRYISSTFQSSSGNTISGVTFKGLVTTAGSSFTTTHVFTSSEPYWEKTLTLAPGAFSEDVTISWIYICGVVISLRTPIVKTSEDKIVITIRQTVTTN